MSHKAVAPYCQVCRDSMLAKWWLNNRAFGLILGAFCFWMKMGLKSETMHYKWAHVYQQWLKAIICPIMKAAEIRNQIKLHVYRHSQFSRMTYEARLNGNVMFYTCTNVKFLLNLSS